MATGGEGDDFRELFPSLHRIVGVIAGKRVGIAL